MVNIVPHIHTLHGMLHMECVCVWRSSANAQSSCPKMLCRVYGIVLKHWLEMACARSDFHTETEFEIKTIQKSFTQRGIHTDS